MGKVIKGSAESEERYTVVIPVRRAPVPAPDENAFVQDSELFVPPSDVPALPAEPAEPAVDLEAIQVRAQVLIDDATSTAQEIIEDAERRAKDVLDAASDRAQTLADETRHQSHTEGYASGVEAAGSEMAQMLDSMREILESTRAQRHTLLKSAEPELVRLAVGIAERVLHQQIALDHGVVVEMARAAITRLVEREKITIRVNPADVERMREHRDELLALGDVKTMLVIEDQRVDRGGVILESEAGSIDAKISTQLAEVRKILHIVDDVVVQPSSSPPDDDDASFATARAS